MKVLAFDWAIAVHMLPLSCDVWSGILLQELRERVLRGKYRIPFYMSTDCENLLKKFLVLNPLKRLALDVCTIYCRWELLCRVGICACVELLCYSHSLSRCVV